MRFFDIDTGQSFAESHVPVQQVPETYEARAMMRLCEADCQVVEARPRAAAKFGKTGTMTLILRHVEVGTANAAIILFSLPTI